METPRFKPTLLESLEEAAATAARVAFSHMHMPGQACHAAYWKGRCDAYEDVAERIRENCVLRVGNHILILRDWRS